LSFLSGLRSSRCSSDIYQSSRTGAAKWQGQLHMQPNRKQAHLALWMCGTERAMASYFSLPLSSRFDMSSSRAKGKVQRGLLQLMLACQSTRCKWRLGAAHPQLLCRDRRRDFENQRLLFQNLAASSLCRPVLSKARAAKACRGPGVPRDGRLDENHIGNRHGPRCGPSLPRHSVFGWLQDCSHQLRNGRTEWKQRFRQLMTSSLKPQSGHYQPLRPSLLQRDRFRQSQPLQRWE